MKEHESYNINPSDPIDNPYEYDTSETIPNGEPRLLDIEYLSENKK